MKAVKTISQLLNIAFSSKNNPAHAELIISKLPIKQAKFIEKHIGENIVGSVRIMDTSGLRHTIKEHGSPVNEAKRGQIAVTIDDFKLVPMVLKEPDRIEYGGKNPMKQDIFLYYKKIGNLYIVAECVRFAKAGNKLVFWSMYKRKK